MWHQTKVHLHTKDGTYSPEGKGQAENEDGHLPLGNELTTATLKLLGGCNGAANKCPSIVLRSPHYSSVFFQVCEVAFNFSGCHGTYLGKISLTLWEKIKTTQYVRETTTDTNL